MTRWSCLVTELRTQTVTVRDLPMTGMSFTDSLTDSGSFTASYPVDFPVAPMAGYNDPLTYRLVWPMRDGQPMGCYLITNYPSTDFDSPVQQVQGTRIDSLLDHRLIRRTLNFVDVDQCDIFRDLIRYGLGRNTEHSTPLVSRDIVGAEVPWIRLDSTLSGVLRTRQETPGNTTDGYPAAARKIVGTCVKQLTELDGGPEYRLNYGMDPGTELPYVIVTQGYPAVGHSPLDPAKPVFEYPGGNILAVKYGVDGTTLITRADVTGQEKEGAKPIGSAVYQDVLDHGFPLWEGTWSESSVQDVNLLNEKATSRLHTGHESWSITLDGGRRPMFGSYDLGDYTWLRLRRRGLQLPDVPVRITGWSVDVDDSGASETVTPTVEQVAIWSVA